MPAATVRRVAERNARDLSGAIDQHVDRAVAEYKTLAPDALADDVGARLSSALATIVHSARQWGHSRGAGDVLDELRAIAPKASVNLGASGPPQRSEVAAYVADAVSEAVAKAAALRDVGNWEQAFVEASYRAAVLIEDQVVREYERAKTAAYQDLERLDDNPDRGFVVARSADQVRAEPQKSAVATVAKRRSEVNDARTCEVCRAQDGQLRLVGMQFSVPIPAHPRCRGISHLWAVGWPWESKTMTDEMLTRWMSTIDVREIQIDEATRTIRDVVVSDESVDSHDSIIRAAGWDLGRYRKNPVLLWAHKGSRSFDPPDPKDTLGTTANWRIDGTRLVMDLVFSPKGINPQADMVFEQMKAKVIRAMSVGFREREYHFEKVEGGELLIIDSATLVEVSVLPVGSNENALARQFRPAGCGDVRETEMTTEKTTAAGATLLTVALPPELASVTGAATIEGAVRKLEDQSNRLAELELKLDKVTKDHAAAEARAVAAEKTVADRIEKETTSEVESLIKAGRLSEDKRAFALKLARTDFEAFRGLYPVEQTAPLAPMLRQVVTDGPAASAPVETQTEDPITKRAAELIAKGVEYTAAWNQAFTENNNKAAG